MISLNFRTCIVLSCIIIQSVCLEGFGKIQHRSPQALQTQASIK